MEVRMKVKRLLSVLLVVMMALTLFSACTTTNSGSAVPSQATNAGTEKSGTDEKTSVKTDVIHVWSNDAHNRDEYMEVINKFNETTGKEKGIKIEYKVYGGDYYNSLDIAISANEEPHLFKSMKTGQYAETGRVVAISDLPGGDKLIEETSKYHFEDIGMFNGKVYGIPIRVTTQNMIYNKEMLSKMGYDNPPVTWEEFRKVAKEITEQGGGKVYGTGLPLKYTNFKYYGIIWPAAASNGIQFFSHKTGKFDFMSLEPYFNFLLQLKEDGSIFPGFETMDYDTLRAQFAEGNIGMYFGASFDVGVLYDQFPAKFEWGVAPIPVMDANNRYKQIGTPGAFYVVSSRALKEKIEDKVMEAYKMFVSPETLALTYEKGKDIPIRGEEIIKLAGTPERPQWPMFTDLTNVYVRLAYPESKITIEGDNYDVVFSKILTGVAKPAEALKELDDRYNQFLQSAIDSGALDINLYLDPNYDENVKYVK